MNLSNLARQTLAVRLNSAPGNQDGMCLTKSKVGLELTSNNMNQSLREGIRSTSHAPGAAA